MSSDPFGNPQGSQFNPYTSPNTSGMMGDRSLVQAVKGKVMPPAICLIIAGVLGLIFSIISIVISLTPAPPIDPNAPEFVRQFQEGTKGAPATIVNILFCFLNITVIAGAVLMMQVKVRPMGFVAAILAIVNFGNCCCIIGIPFGIWSLIILMQPDVARAFQQNST